MCYYFIKLFVRNSFELYSAVQHSGRKAKKKWSLTGLIISIYVYKIYTNTVRYKIIQKSTYVYKTPLTFHLILTRPKSRAISCLFAKKKPRTTIYINTHTIQKHKRVLLQVLTVFLWFPLFSTNIVGHDPEAIIVVLSLFDITFQTPNDRISLSRTSALFAHRNACAKTWNKRMMYWYDAVLMFLRTNALHYNMLAQYKDINQTAMNDNIIIRSTLWDSYKQNLTSI